MVEEIDRDKETEEIDRERSANVAKSSEKIKKKIQKTYEAIEKGFLDEQARVRVLGEYWDLYNCILGSRQSYNGDNAIFIPSVFQAVNARATRFINQVFPFSGLHIEVHSADAKSPRARTALGEHYIRKAGLRSVILEAMINKDVEGHCWLYTSWHTDERHVVSREKKEISTDTAPVGEVDDLKNKIIEDSYPKVEVLPDSDVLVLPATADTLEDALDEGGHVTIVRRWSEQKLKDLLAAGAIDKKAGEEALDRISKSPQAAGRYKDRAKQSLFAAGVRSDGRGKYMLVFQTFVKLDLPEGRRICEVFYAGHDLVLHAHRNPLWCDKLPIIGCPAIKLPGAHKGRSPLSSVDTLQYFINDIANLGADSAQRGMVPITMTDPNSNPRAETMKIIQGAVWFTDPRVTQIVKFPEMWKDSGAIVTQVDGIIKTTLGVNPSMITQYQRPSKPTNAQVQQEHAVDLLTTATEVTLLEETLLTPWITLAMEMDKQYRDSKLQIRSFGELGMQAVMEEIEPEQEDRLYAFVWFGVEQVRSESRMQTQMALINVARNIPPQMYPGYTMDISPVLANAFNSVFGARLGRLVFKDTRSPLSMNPELENELMEKGHDIGVHMLDDHQAHMQIHLQAMQDGKDTTGSISRHFFKHQVAAASVARSQQEAVAPQNPPGPSTGGRSRGARPGAMPSKGRPMQAPAGAQKMQNRSVVGMPMNSGGRAM